ncbi:MAG TPA: hypothetical protein VGP46_07185 [Acidimicrobiales bacterium]|nr:hypothetical protein [Acidimicrobiales bacterium]
MVAIAVSVPVALVGAEAALAAGLTVPSGYTLTTPWTASWVSGNTTTTSVTAPLPGNLSALGDATFAENDASADQQLGGDSSASDNVVRVNPDNAIVNATSTQHGLNGVPEGKSATFATLTDTITLATPVVDPIIAIEETGGGWAADNGSGQVIRCTSSWPDTTITGVNGSSPSASQLSLVGSVAGNATYSNGTVNLSMSYIDANACSAPASDGYTYIELHGLVSSITLANGFLGTITRDSDGGQVAVSSIYGTDVALMVPQADLSINKTATVNASATIQWTINVTNNGPSASHGFVVNDVVPSGVQNVKLVSAPAGCTLSGSTLTCAEAPAGCTVSQNATVATLANLTCANSLDADSTVLASGSSFGPIVLSGVGQPSTTYTNTATVSGVDSDQNTSNNTSTVGITTEATPLLDPAVAIGTVAIGGGGLFALRRRRKSTARRFKPALET